MCVVHVCDVVTGNGTGTSCVALRGGLSSLRAPISPSRVGGEGRGLPPAPQCFTSGRVWGRTGVCAGVTQLPSFAKEIRTLGWQSRRCHICSLRILCCCYSTRCLTPAAPSHLQSLWPRLGRGWSHGCRPPAVLRGVGLAVHLSSWRWNWDSQRPFRFCLGRAGGQ